MAKVDEELNWSEPFMTMLSAGQEDQRVEEEGGVRLGESIISSRLLDAVLFAVMMAMVVVCLVTVHYEEQILPVFVDVAVYKRLALWLTGMIGGSVLLQRVSIKRLTAVRAASSATILYLLTLLLRFGSPAITKDKLVLVLCHFAAFTAVTFAPVFTSHLQRRYLQDSFGHKQAVYRGQTKMVSDLVGRDVRVVGVEDLGDICRMAFYRLSGDGHHLSIADFNKVLPDSGGDEMSKARRAYLLFAPNTDTKITNRKFAYTISDIINEWRLIKHSTARSTAIFSVFSGLLDFVSVMLSLLFVMAVLGFSALDMIGAALFMYGIVYGFLGEAVQQWKLGTYLIIAVHPYDIGDMVRVPCCGKTPLTVVDYSLTRTLFRKPEGQSVTMQHRHMAYQDITNLSRPRTHRVVLTLSAEDTGGVPVATFIHQICDTDPHFKSRFQISTRGGRYALQRRTRIQLTFEEGLNARQRLRGLVAFCSTLKEAALEAQVHDDEDV